MLRNRLILRKVVAIAICLAGTTMFSGCDKEKENPIDDGQSGTTNNGYDVYVAGNEYEIAKLWKNGIAQELEGTNASSVFIYGNDVYVAGTKYEDYYTNSAMLWKNGVAQTLGQGRYGGANSVYVLNGDVYVAGSASRGILSDAKVWKNGKEIYSFSSGYAYGISVFAYNNDVYLLGNDRKDWSTTPTYKLWKNGEQVHTFGDSPISSIFVSGMYWYAVGFMDYGSYYWETVWKNGVSQNLLKTYSTGSMSIYVSGGDTYVVGFESSSSSSAYKAILWKNGEKQNLSDGTMNEYATSVYVTPSGDVYVAGYEQSGSHSAAKIWINGKAQMLTDGTKSARANSIFVVEKK